VLSLRVGIGAAESEQCALYFRRPCAKHLNRCHDEHVLDRTAALGGQFHGGQLVGLGRQRKPAIFDDIGQSTNNATPFAALQWSSEMRW
jgi:hypothetical protein